MRILKLNYKWPPLERGGGPVAENLAKMYAAFGHTTEVVAIRYRETAGDCGVPALTQALRELLSSPQRVRERRAAAGQRGEQRYGWHAMGLRYLDVLQGAASIQAQEPAS
jgi:glycosyltransferase involved in cell wall biosynthesis